MDLVPHLADAPPLLRVGQVAAYPHLLVNIPREILQQLWLLVLFLLLLLDLPQLAHQALAEAAEHGLLLLQEPKSPLLRTGRRALPDLLLEVVVLLLLLVGLHTGPCPARCTDP